MGFNSVDAFFEDGPRLEAAIVDGSPLSLIDWARALVATEIVFASNVFGGGRDWLPVTGWSDERTIQILRQVQRKLLRVKLVVGHGLGTRPDKKRK
jgi:hypothetical protein